MRFFPSPRLLLAILLIASAFFSIFASQLADDEVKTLREIKQSLGKTNGWDFDVDPCSGQGGWYESDDININCTCPTVTNGTSICHVQRIILKGQNLSGVLPLQLFKLPYLVEFDVTRNYLSGTIPSQWGSTRLVVISLLGNRLTGSIPREIGNITSLVSLVVECNQLSGSLPPELGNLIRIERLLLSSNNFTGMLPPTLANLTALKEFRIPDNNFTGKIPDFIENWTNLEELFIQSSGLQGPIPDGIALLQKVTDLRITDLNGPEARFPQLDKMTSLKTLILRSCNLSGLLPEYFRDMTVLKNLDLSFNKLSGIIPSNVIGPSVRFMYLTGNLFTGPVPDLSAMKKVNVIDFSYNNFTSGYSGCHRQKMNFFGRSLESNKPGNLSCLESSMTCPKKHYGFYINCGGEATTIGKITYDADNTDSAIFSQSSGNNWGLSSTGDFMGDEINIDTYTTKNRSILVMNNTKLYMSARLSPLSLTYFGFCLGNGNYTVNLHFAEIIFTDDKTYASLGRRIFDVYVQEKLVLTDFNIEKEAGGVGKEVIKCFPANVTSSTLEIRFYWKGRGTTSLPERGVYGPLISAISVKSDFKPPTHISTSAVVGIVAAVAFVIILILGIVIWCKFDLWRKARMERDLKDLDLHTNSFTLRQIKAATNNFDAANKIGEGGFGSVYKTLFTQYLQPLSLMWPIRICYSLVVSLSKYEEDIDAVERR